MKAWLHALLLHYKALKGSSHPGKNDEGDQNGY